MVVVQVMDILNLPPLIDAAQKVYVLHIIINWLLVLPSVQLVKESENAMAYAYLDFIIAKVKVSKYLINI